MKKYLLGYALLGLSALPALTDAQIELNLQKAAKWCSKKQLVAGYFTLLRLHEQVPPEHPLYPKISDQIYTHGYEALEQQRKFINQLTQRLEELVLAERYLQKTPH